MAVDKSKSIIMAKRLKDLRIGKGLSHESLRKALVDKYEIDISVDSLKNYEVSKVPHAKAYKNDGMRVEYLRCLADFYGVSSDYILGITENKTSDANAINAIAYTGLSEDIATLLHIVSNLEEFHGSSDSSMPEIIINFLDRAKNAENIELLKFEIFRLIETLIVIIAKDPLLFGPAFQNYIWGEINSVAHSNAKSNYVPDESVISELNKHGYQVMQSHRYAEWQLNLVFDELKHRARTLVYQHAKQNYKA